MRSLKKMLSVQEVVVGLMVQHVCAPWIAKIYADAGSDFVYVENEHMFFNEADLASLILACRLCDMPVVAKSSYVDRGNICKLLDAGVTGLQLPMSESASQLEQVVKYVKYPPVGVRAASPGTGNTSYEPVDTVSWLKQSNEETLVIAHIETKTGVEKADEILSVPGVDMMFIGMFDLTVSLGHPAKFNHPEVARAVDRLVSAAKDHNAYAGMWAPTFEEATRWMKRGVRFFETSGDIGFIAKGATELIKQFPGHGPRVSGGEGHF